MRALRLIIGMIAAVYALAQVIQLTMMFAFGNIDLTRPNSGSMIFGTVAGILIGLAIAILCFRRKK